MMKPLLRLLLPIFGVLVIVSALSSGSSVGRSGVGFFLSLLLGAALVVAPFFALGVLVMYALMLLCIVGGPVLGAYLGVLIGGKGSALVWFGLIFGAYVGIKFALSERFGRILRPAESIAKPDEQSK